MRLGTDAGFGAAEARAAFSGAGFLEVGVWQAQFWEWRFWRRLRGGGEGLWVGEEDE